MKNNRIHTLLAVLVAVLSLTACSSQPKIINKQAVADDGGNVSDLVKLSPQRIAEIRQAFIGRSFVFKEDWYEYAIIDSDPLGGFGDPVPVTTFPTWMENNNYRVRAASAGTVAKIVGLRMYRDGLAFICDKEGGGRAYLIIINIRPGTLLFGRRNSDRLVQRNAMKDDRITVPWIERNLTYHTVEFIDDLPDVPDVKLALPQPPSEPTLTPLPAAGLSVSAPAVVRLAIQADPSPVRPNEVLNLVLDFSVESAGAAAVSVRETRSLMRDGNALPGYPKSVSESRQSGRYTTNFQQTIPARARAGVYLFRGEVCAEQECVSRSVEFQVAP